MVISYKRQVVPLRDYLAAVYPNCFTRKGSGLPKRPLAIGIYNDILRDFPHMYRDRHVLNEMLKCWTLGVIKDGNFVIGARRIDLIGNEIGEVSQKDVDHWSRIKENMRLAVRKDRARRAVEEAKRRAADTRPMSPTLTEWAERERNKH